MNGQAYYFEHPCYGRLRAINTADGIFFSLDDLVHIIDIKSKKLFSILADTDGRVVDFSVVERIGKDVEDAFLLRELDVDENYKPIAKKGSKVSHQLIFVDRQMMGGMMMDGNPWMKLLFKWVDDFILPVMHDPQRSCDHACQSVQYVMYSFYLHPIAIDLRYDGLYINDRFII